MFRSTKTSNPPIRLALLCGAATALGAALLSPGEAAAQCSPAAPAPGAGADTINCANSSTAYAPAGTNGIVFTSSGDLTVNLTGAGNSNLGSRGVSLTAGGLEDDLAFTLSRIPSTASGSSNGNISGTGNTAAALVNLQSQNGDIRVTIGDGQQGGGVSGNAANVQYGVRARSSGAGDINLIINGSGGISTGTAAGNAGIAAVEATSNGGDITILHDFAAAGTGGPTLTGRLYGIRASTTGAGNLTLNSIPRVSGSPTQISVGSVGVAAIDASVGTGLLTLNLVGGVSNSNVAGTGIKLTTQGGNAVVNRNFGSVNVGGGGGAAASNIFDLTMSGGTTTINGNVDGGFGSNSPGRSVNGMIRASGDGTIVLNNNVGVVSGQFRLGDFDGDFTFNNHSGYDGWVTQGVSEFAGGTNIINNLEGAVIGVGRNLLVGTCPDLGGCGLDSVELQTATLNFNGAADVFNNEGAIVLGEVEDGGAPFGQTLEINGLEVFNHHGRLVMGTIVPSGIDPDRPADLPTGVVFYTAMPTDRMIDDLFRLRDSRWVGHEGSTIVLDANFNVPGGAQTSCTRNVDGLAQNAVHDRAEGSFPFSDCLDMRGTTIEGRTGVVVLDIGGGDRGAYSPEGNVIVDVAGGTAEPDAFFIAPGSTGYNPAGGGFADKGLFLYAVAYDADDEQFKIYGFESPGTQQFALLGQAANELWRTATTSWYERQTELRELAQEPVGGTWIRGVFDRGERESVNVVTLGATDFEFDNSHTQDRGAVTVGRDWVIAGDGDVYGVVGAMVGYARNRISFDEYANTANFEGPSAGVYGGVTAGSFYVDAAVNGVWAVMDNDIPTLNLIPVGTILSTDVQSYGAQVETGWRLDFGLAQLTPLAGLSWTSSTIAAMNIPASDPIRLGGEVEFDDIVSLRTSLGARVSASDLLLGFMPTAVSLTARAVQENDGEAAVSLINVGPTAHLSNVFDGTFGEVNAALAVGSEDGAASGYLNLGGLFGSEYRSLGASLGFRYQW